MSIHYSKRLERMPGYKAGVPKGKAPEAIASSDIAQLASNESPYCPDPSVVEAMQRAAVATNRYPDPGATLLRSRIAARYDVDPGSVAVANGSCEILLAAAEALLEPGAEVVYGWPAFSMYPYLAALTGAREIRVPLTDADEHDLDAMLAEITAATQLVLVCNPNNPTSTHIPHDRLKAFLAEVPDHVAVIVDEAYIEFQLNDDPDATIDIWRRSHNLILLRTFSKCFGLAGLRVGYALCPARFRAAVDSVRQPFSVNAVAQAAAAEAIRNSDRVTERVERTIVERIFVEEGLRDLGFEGPESQANFSWFSLGDRDEEEVVAALAADGIVVRAGTPLGGPGYLRVSYGTREQNERFLASLAKCG